MEKHLNSYIGKRVNCIGGSASPSLGTIVAIKDKSIDDQSFLVQRDVRGTAGHNGSGHNGYIIHGNTPPGRNDLWWYRLTEFKLLEEETTNKYQIY